MRKPGLATWLGSLEKLAQPAPAHSRDPSQKLAQPAPAHSRDPSLVR